MCVVKINKCMLQCTYLFLCSACSTINLTSKHRFLRLCFKVNAYTIIPQEIILIVVKCLCIFKYLGVCLHQENEEVGGKSNKSFK